MPIVEAVVAGEMLSLEEEEGHRDGAALPSTLRTNTA
jgi:hypothetical protein